MPNHVTQVLHIAGDGAYEAIDALFTDFDQMDKLTGRREQWRAFDFAKLIPTPAIIAEVEDGSDRYIPFLMQLDGAHLLWEDLRLSSLPQIKERPLPVWSGFTSMRGGWMEKHLRHTFGDAPIDNAYKMIQCFAATGHKGWYEWCIANYGTKWNAYRTSLERTENGATLRMQTAWSVPLPVLEALARRLPQFTLTYYAFDEGWNFCASGGAFGGNFGIDTFTPDHGSEHTTLIYRECYQRDPDISE